MSFEPLVISNVQRAKVPRSESSRERKFHPMELSFPGAKVLRNESSCYGTDDYDDSSEADDEQPAASTVVWSSD